MSHFLTELKSLSLGAKAPPFAGGLPGEENIFFIAPQMGHVGEEDTTMGCVRNLEAFNCSDWETWKTNVRERIAVARRFGVPDETIQAIAVEVGNFLSENVCPAIKQEELLKAMWSLATPGERKTLAALALKWFDQPREEMATNEVNPSTPRPTGLGLLRADSDGRFLTPP